jgi:UDP-N-acetylmuramoyl-tripeptide--D-alanyl-D-alanine ligase
MTIEEIYELLKSNNYKFSTDSRKINPGDIFFALKGENYDANLFAEYSLEKGAAFAIVDSKNLPANKRLIAVENVLNVLQNLATFHRLQLEIPVIAIGGSNGKTTTKELIAAILGTKYKIHVTQGNLNNQIGLPITLLSATINTEIIILEMGANHIGEIAELCEIAKPTHGLITNIGKEHLEGFGSIEGVARGESELYHYLQNNGGLAFVNMDDKWLRSMSKRLTKICAYGVDNPQHFIAGKIIQSSPLIIGEIDRFRITSRLSGDYNFENILAAAAVGKYFDVPDADIQTAIAQYKPTNNRSQVIEKNSNWILLDAYNANPSSVEKALENFSYLKHPNKIVILGDMFELGDFADSEHRLIAQKASTLGFNKIVLVGPFFSRQINEISALGFNNFEELEKWVRCQNFKNTAFLIKGSRGMAMERIVPAIVNEGE